MHRQFQIRILLLVLLLSAAGQGVARIINVSSASAVNKTWTAGDTLVFANGSYTNLSLTLNGTGTAAQPIVLRAANAGEVTFGGSCNLTIKGTYIEVIGFRFAGTYTGKNPAVQFESSSAHCRLTGSAIEAYNTADVTKDLKWVSIKGKEHRIDHCYFAGKTNMGTLLVVWLESGVVPKHQIEYNHFGYREPNLDSDNKPLNGQEIIRIGDSSTSMQEAQCVVANNYFENCDGEIEIISNKSCGNIYRYNTFYACAGMLTLRHGNGCTVTGNWFYGGGKDGSGGVRIIGENHVVTGNYFQDLTGNNYRAGVCIVRGKPDSELNEYFQVKNAQVTGNTFVHCKEAFCVNYHSSSECNLLAINTTIENNTVYNDDSHKSYRIVTYAASGGSVTWQGNTYNAGKFNSYTPLSSEWAQDKSMTQPQAESGSPSAETTGPAWMHASSPTEAVGIQEQEDRIRKILHNGHVIIFTASRRQLYIL